MLQKLRKHLSVFSLAIMRILQYAIEGVDIVTIRVSRHIFGSSAHLPLRGKIRLDVILTYSFYIQIKTITIFISKYFRLQEFH